MMDNIKKCWLIEGFLTPSLAIFQLYRGANDFIIYLDIYMTLRNKTYFSIKQTGYMYKYKLCSIWDSSEHRTYSSVFYLTESLMNPIHV